MPMARATAHAAGGARRRSSRLAARRRRGDSDAHRLAADGVSCTLCHQIGAERLGTRESFVGGFTSSARSADGRRDVRAVRDRARAACAIMRSATGFQPAEGDHMRQSELCATCHTLYTQALGPDGEVVGSLPEQMPYLEWQHSAFARASEAASRATCQSVAADADAHRVGARRAARAPGAAHVPRRQLLHAADAEPVIGGELGVEALPQELEAAAQRDAAAAARPTRRASRSRAASRRSGTLDVDVVVPQPRPATSCRPAIRRAASWLHLTVRDAAGACVFESGAVDADGRDRRQRQRRRPARFEPHYDEIRSADQVQIYESVMADARRRGDDRPADGRRVREGQPAAAARIRQDRGSRRHRRSRRRRPPTPTFAAEGDRGSLSVDVG